MGNIDFFNQLAERTGRKLENGRRISFFSDVYKNTFADIQKKLKISRNDVVLDLGGGTGRITEYLSRVGGQIHLLDGAESAVRNAQNSLKNCANISYMVADFENLLPYDDNYFDKILCYSVVHYLKNLESFEKLVGELIRVAKPVSGLILIADIPLDEKYKAYLTARRKKPVKNFLLNMKYYFIKYSTDLWYCLKGIKLEQFGGASYTKDVIRGRLSGFDNIEYDFFEQSDKLPLCSSREDLLIRKVK